MIGLRFGDLLVKSYVRKDHGQWYMLCLCDCGNEKAIRDDHIKSGGSTSCGDCNYQAKHLQAYRSWDCMISRCSNPNASNYARYGGRGITYPTYWGKFKKFLADMGDPTTPEHEKYRYTLDRIDNDKDYSKENCRWASKSEQTQNSSWVLKNRKG